MIDKYITSHKEMFVDYDIGEIRKKAEGLDKKISDAFEELLDTDTLKNGPIYVKIQDLLNQIQSQCGEYVFVFYDTVYGCVLSELLQKNLDSKGGK